MQDDNLPWFKQSYTLLLNKEDKPVSGNRKTSRRERKANQGARSRRDSKQGFKVYYDSIGRPYIDVNEALSSEAGKRLFDEFKELRQPQ